MQLALDVFYHICGKYLIGYGMCLFLLGPGCGCFQECPSERLNRRTLNTVLSHSIEVAGQPKITLRFVIDRLYQENDKENLVQKDAIILVFEHLQSLTVQNSNILTFFLKLTCYELGQKHIHTHLNMQAHERAHIRISAHTHTHTHTQESFTQSGLGWTMCPLFPGFSLAAGDGQSVNYFLTRPCVCVCQKGNEASMRNWISEGKVWSFVPTPSAC